ncbi:ATP-binding protein [Sorangium sp. So ce1036]|uniref:hybrid sensor histidine kinase/response regulator n=1 Tax=Sorangium sp. So ce1036 TaxID=3133328 RepID=UPI003F0F5296
MNRPADTPPQRILIVDDSPAYLHRVAAAMRDEGYLPVLAHSGEEALARLMAARVDGILLDMVMPGLSGPATCLRIKANAVWRSIPLVMLTGRDDHQAIVDALSAGADDFVTKSGELTVLKARLRAQLRRKHHEDENRRMRELLLRREMEAAEARADRRLRQSEERFRLLVEGVQDYAIVMLDPEGRIESWNPGAERINGYRADEVIGRHCSILCTIEDIELGRPAAELKATVETGRSVQEGYRVRKDGTRYWANEVISVLLDESGRLRGFAKVTRDVTERRRVHEAQRILVSAGQILGESLDFEETLRRVVRVALPDFASICVLLLQDESGAIERQVTAHAHPSMAAATELLGRITADCAGRGIGKVLRTAQPEIIPRVTDSFVRAIALDEAHYEALRALAFASHLTVPLVARGRTLGTLSFASTHRRYDAADLDLAQDLARRAALAVDNARLYREAQLAVRARDEFLTIASHELRTPLTPMQLQIDGLLRAGKRGGLTAERAMPRLERIRRQVERLARLISNLLDISRISAGRLQIELEDVDLTATVDGALERFREELCAAGCSVYLSAPASVTGRWDRLRLDQIVTNLLSNAVKYGAGRPIDVEVEDLGDRARLTVRDRGIGIAPDQQARIFERFERAVSSENYSGFGMGLWIVRQIADALGATIAVDSKQGEGAVFTVELPKVPRD